MRECVERSNQLLVLSGLLTLPPEIGQLTELRGLTLHDNQLTTLPPEICKLTKLTYLGLRRNQFTTFAPEIAKLTNLQIWGNQFSGPLPRELANCALLASLGGVENGRMKGIVGPCPAEILAMPRLTQAARDGLARLS